MRFLVIVALIFHRNEQRGMTGQITDCRFRRNTYGHNGRKTCERDIIIDDHRFCDKDPGLFLPYLSGRYAGSTLSGDISADLSGICNLFHHLRGRDPDGTLPGDRIGKK